MHDVITYLEEQVKVRPKKTLFSDSNGAITYEDFRIASLKVAKALKINSVCGKPVVVLISKSVNSLVMMFGAVYARNYYVPIDPELPEERLQSIMKTLSAEVILCEKRHGDTAKHLDVKQVIIFDEICGGDISNDDIEMIMRDRKDVLDTDPLYVIFTSGSTGVPKGVVVSHRSVIDLMEQFKKEFFFTDDDVFASQAPFDFDVSVKDIYCTVSNGASMVIIDKKMFSQPINLVKKLAESHITTMIWAVSALNIIAQWNGLKNIKPGSLRRIMFSGEAISNKVLNYFRRNMPDVMYVNLYGPTEITCNCAFYKVDRPFRDDEPLPIGRAFDNTGIMLLTENGELAERGEKGEICVRGTCLALGYFGDKEKSEKSFCQNPFNRDWQERIYHTGDIAYENEFGELVFASRKDSQIKHMGHRIELGEIEIFVNALSYISGGFCYFDGMKIILFYEAQADCHEKILKDLMKKLPRYMCPNQYIRFDKMPMNNHGKIDRVKIVQDYCLKEGDSK